MGLMQMPLFSALADKMRWHQARQGVLAENVANADTPGFRGHDLAKFSIGDQSRVGSLAMVSTSVTQPNHIAVSASGSAGGFAAQAQNSFEITPDGNGISLEDQMLKATTNMMDYQAATTVYQRSVKVLRTALGRSA